jgi:hypothetical protein
VGKFVGMGAAVLGSALILLLADPGVVMVSVLTGIIGGAILVLVEAIARDWSHLRLVGYSLWHWREPIRISAAYSFRIVVDGKYLLVRGRRFKNQFQPVGGVYKTNARSAEILDQLRVVSDGLFEFDTNLSNDLRVRIPGSKLVPFMRWFNSGRGRETSPWREFREELLTTDYLDAKVFGCIEYEFLGRQSEFRHSRLTDCWELLVADVFELLPTPEQIAELRRAAASPEADYCWVTADAIRQRTTQVGRPETEAIADNTRWLL